MRAAPRSRTLRLWILACFAAVAALIGAVLVPMSAQATSVELSGSVTGPARQALSGVSITAIKFTFGIPDAVATTTTTSTGAYAFASLSAAAEYTLQFGATSASYPQYLGHTTDISSAETFPLVAAGSFHATINASLGAGGNISGTVKSISHAALKGYTVRAFANGSDQTALRSAVTSATGAYTVTGLAPGSYQLEVLDTAASPPYAPAYSGGTTTLDNATAVVVASGETSAYSFTLGTAGGVAGVVTGVTTSGTKPLGDVTVTPYLLSGTEGSFTGSSTTGMPSVVTNSSGAYSIHGLLPGFYTFEYTPGPSTTVYADDDPFGQKFLDSDSGYATVASYVHVLGGSTISGIDQQLEEEANATVNVTDSSSSQPIPNIQVTIDNLGATANQPGDTAAQTGITDANGSVTFHGLSNGFYEAIVGANSNAGGTITTYQREIVDFNGQLVSGTTSVQNITATLKDPDGLHTSADQPLSCCGGGPNYVVGDYIAVDPDAITWNNDDVDASKDTVQWYRNGKAIPGATGTNYELQADDAGTTVIAVVTGYDLAYGSGTTQTVPITVGLGSLSQIGGGGGTYGTDEVGRTLTYEDDGWTQEGVVETHEWQRSINSGSTWTDISPQPTPDTSYTLQPGDLGDEIRVEMTASLPGYTSVVEDSPSVPVYDGSFTLVAAPKLTTTSTTWSMSSGTWSPNAGTTQYLWTVYPSNGSSPAQFTTSSIPRAGTTGDLVTVTAFRDPAAYNGYFAPTVTAQTGAAPVPSGSEVITGTPQYNTTQHAGVPTFTPAVSSVDCAWQYKSGSTWKALPGATQCVYTPVVADIGRLLRVVLTTVSAGYATRTIIETEPSAITTLQFANTLSPGISGTTGTGEVVTAGTGNWVPSPGALSYRWLYSATGLAPYKTAPGVSTLSSYTIPQSLLGQTLVVQVTASLSGYASKTVTNSAGVVNKGELTNLTLPKTKLTGTAATGETVTFSGATYSPAASTINYNYYVYNASNNLVANGTAPSYAIPTAYDHDVIMVQAGGFLAGYPSPAWTNLVVAKKGDNLPSGTLFISGDAVGTAITSSGITWGVASSTVTYQWQYKSGSSWVSIAGATSASFTPTSTYLAHTLRLVETATATNYNTASVMSSNTETVAVAAAPTPGSGSSAPAISGSNIVGHTLTATPGTWSVAGTTFSYQWQLSPDGSTWTNIAGATASHLVVPQSAYLDSDYVGVVVRASRAGYGSGSFEAVTPGTTDEGQITMVKAPVVTVAGAKLTVAHGTWSNATSYGYLWDAFPANGGAPTAVGASSTLTTTSAEAGEAIVVVVYAYGTNYQAGGTSLIARSGGPITPTNPITVAGTPVTDGGTLTANWTGFSVASPSVIYQWYRSGVAISGATAQDYSPVAADVGKILSVTLTVYEQGWTTEKYSATSTVTQSGIAVDDITTPTISGTPGVDSVLTAVPPMWNESGVTVTYQWYSGNTAIPGATGKSYLVTAADLGNDIYVALEGTHPYQQPGYDQTGPLTIGLGTALAPASPAKITGTVGIGKVLSATSGTWNFPVTLAYQWQYNAPATSTWNNISGANASTYTPTVADGIAASGDIRVLITASRPGHNTVTVTSAVVTIP